MCMCAADMCACVQQIYVRECESLFFRKETKRGFFYDTLCNVTLFTHCVARVESVCVCECVCEREREKSSGCSLCCV